ncbi:MAG: TetR/AcrR family transcriptional regulator [Candidatus Obscuribacterales bacterium]|nr:TetR/AcrR family transcriptional regulator [Candidatus Obscuribacterales bacterium]
MPHLNVLANTNERYSSVLAAAARLIADEGFERASIRAISRAAALSQAGVYHYFSCKEDILYQIQKNTFTALRNSLAARLDDSMSSQERLRVSIGNHLEFFIAHINELKVCTFEHQKLTGDYYQRILTVRRDYFRIVNKIVGEVLEENGDCKADSKRLTLYIFGSLNWIHMWYDTSRRTDVDIIVDEISNMVLFGIAGRGK